MLSPEINEPDPAPDRLHLQLRRILELARWLRGIEGRFFTTAQIHAGYELSAIGKPICERTIRRDLGFLAELGVVEYRRTTKNIARMRPWEWRWRPGADLLDMPQAAAQEGQHG
jgi:hypothetical protein